MKDKKYIVAMDQGTTSSRAVLFNKRAEIVAVEQKEFPQIFPKAGWVEHNPMEILESQLTVFTDLIKKYNISADEIASIGITNQRETTVVWEKDSGKPIYNAIVWQDKRTAPLCEELKREGVDVYFQKETGLVVDAYFSGTKLNWILKNVPKAMERAEKGELLFGTIDTWLIWNLTKGKVHATDYSNASRTMLYNINTLQWDLDCLDMLQIPKAVLPEVRNSSDNYGSFLLEGVEIPIHGVAGDQQAALFGQCCFHSGEAKNTYGTGCFMLMNTGEQKITSEKGLLTTIAWGLDGKVSYALEGSVFIAGAAVQWLRDGLKTIQQASETEKLAESANESDVIVVPAFAGLGAPYWDMYARGAIFGLTRDTGIAELSKATLESLAYQTKDVLTAMEKEANTKLQFLNVDGGASENNYLMQFQADILQTDVKRPQVLESTALGAAFLAGIYSGFWKKEELLSLKSSGQIFTPNMNKETVQSKYALWQKAVKRSMNWVES